MMAPPTRRALLIGIDHYLVEETRPLQRYNSLAGCVNDVKNVAKFLESVGVTDITKLTAPSRAEEREEVGQQYLPTYANIVLHLEQLSSRCRPGDLVYIHYSGHGVLRKGMIPDDGGDNLMGTALVPTDALTSRKYLTGYQVGVRVRKMVEDQEVRACVVLDSCFSEGGFGMPATVTPRSVEIFGNELDTMKESDLTAAEIASSLSHGTREAEFMAKWFANPTKCSIIMACGSKQVAGESFLGGSDFKQGVLTYWMLELLAQHNTALLNFPTYARIREHVHVNTITTNGSASQTPSVRGDGDVEFFGDKIRVERPTCHVLTSSGNAVTLDVGSVQGVAKGAVYNIYLQHDSKEGEPYDLPAAQVRVTAMSTFQSCAELIRNLNSPNSPPIPRGSRAVLHAWALPQPVGVQLLHGEPQAQSDFLDEIEKTPNLSFPTDPTKSADFVVSINADGNFEIHERGVRLQRLPIVSQWDPDAIEKIAYVVRHLARYRSIEGILNCSRTTHLRDDDFVFTLSRPKIGSPSFVNDRMVGDDGEEEMMGDEGKDEMMGDEGEDEIMGDEDEDELDNVVPGDNGRYRVHENDFIIYTFSYHGPFDALWMAIFLLSSSWGIRKVYPGKGQNAEEIWSTEPGLDPLVLRIKLNIPPKCADSDPDDTVDKIVVFAASKSDDRGVAITAPCWDELALPPLPVDSSVLPLDDKVDAWCVDEDSSRGDSQMQATKVSGPRRIFWYSTSFDIHTFPERSNMAGEAH